MHYDIVIIHCIKIIQYYTIEKFHLPEDLGKGEARCSDVKGKGKRTFTIY